LTYLYTNMIHIQRIDEFVELFRRNERDITKAPDKETIPVEKLLDELKRAKATDYKTVEETLTKWFPKSFDKKILADFSSGTAKWFAENINPTDAKSTLEKAADELSSGIFKKYEEKSDDGITSKAVFARSITYGENNIVDLLFVRYWKEYPQQAKTSNQKEETEAKNENDIADEHKVHFVIAALTKRNDII